MMLPILPQTELMDHESLFLVKEAYKEAYKMLSINKDTLATIANILTTQETVSGDIIMTLLTERCKYDNNEMQ